MTCNSLAIFYLSFRRLYIVEATIPDKSLPLPSSIGIRYMNPHKVTLANRQESIMFCVVFSYYTVAVWVIEEPRTSAITFTVGLSSVSATIDIPGQYRQEQEANYVVPIVHPSIHIPNISQATGPSLKS